MSDAKISLDERNGFAGRVLLSIAGLLGAAGVGIGAAGAHAGGGDLAKLASLYLLIHAGAVLGLGVAARQPGRAWPFVTAGLLLATGAGAFGGDLAILSFTGSHVLRLLAPLGGILLVLGWIAVALLPWFLGRSSANVL